MPNHVISSLLSDIRDRGLLPKGGTVAALGCGAANNWGLPELFDNIDSGRVLVVDGTVDPLPELKSCVPERLCHDLSTELNRPELKGAFDLVLDLGASNLVADPVQVCRTAHYLCRKNGVIVSRQPMLGGRGYFNFIQEYFEDIAALNDYAIAASGFVVSNCIIPLSARLETFFDSDVDVDIVFVFVHESSGEFLLPYQNVAVRDAHGITGFACEFDGGSHLRRYQMIKTMEIERHLSTREALRILARVVQRRVLKLARNIYKRFFNA